MMVPPRSSASGTSSKATAASRTPPPKEVTKAATRAGTWRATATPAPAKRLPPTASPKPIDAATLLTERWLPHLARRCNGRGASQTESHPNEEGPMTVIAPETTREELRGLKGKNVLVTGGTTRNGQAISVRL